MKSESGGISPLDNIGVYRYRFPLMVFFITAATLFVGGAVSIPFFFESPSMWYKFGLAKVLLRSGKVIGILAAVLLFYQLILVSRLRILDQVFSLPRLVRAHRYNAVAVILLAGLHPICILSSENTLLIPLEMRYWPEWAGVGLLAAIASQFSISQWRTKLGMRFDNWLLIHRCLGVSILGLLIVHILFVSETFSEKGLPREATILSAVLLALLWLWNCSGWLRARKKPFTVTRIASEGISSVSIELSPIHKRPFRYVPGQFVIVSFQSKKISPEPHPFTLSSTPTRPEYLQVTVRTNGDWTQHVERIAVGERAYMQGPFGRFSHVFTDPAREIIMIAGGIGITPMLSMMRFMADRQDQRAITLIWSNRSRDHMVYPDELEEFGKKLTGFRSVLIFTGVSDEWLSTEGLNLEKLQSILKGCSNNASIFLCGPEQMMVQVKNDLKRIGFGPRSIHTETFGF